MPNYMRFLGTLAACAALVALLLVGLGRARRGNPPLEHAPQPSRSDNSLRPLSEAELVAALRHMLDEESAADRFAGAVLLVRNDSGNTREVYSGAYGQADRERGVPNAIDTRFRIGSMSKMFTATAILQLVEAGRISFSDVIGSHIPDYPNRAIATQVTVGQLLTHTGGTGDFFGPQYEMHRLQLRTHDDYISLLGERGPAFPPGSRWAYSNYGMVLLGVILERVTATSYYDYIREHIYAPAGMGRSGSEPESEPVQDRAVGYTRADTASAWAPATSQLGYRGNAAGGGYSTVGDLARFANALISGELLGSEHTQLLIKGKIDLPGSAKYAYGFVDTRENGTGWVGHNGGAPGMNGELRIYFPEGYVLAILSNLDPPAAGRIAAFVHARLPRS